MPNIAEIEDKEMQQKTIEAKEVIRETLQKAKNPFVAFTGGKDSLTTLHLVRSVSQKQVSALFIDTSGHFEDIYQFVEKIRRLWGIRLIKERNEKALRDIAIAQDKESCCSLLKAAVLRDSIARHEIDYLFTGIRRDELEMRRNEEFISPRDGHIRVNPVVFFTEKDIWAYIKENNLPYCSLYDNGYRSIDCWHCTSKTPEGAREREGRARGKEEIMSKLRNLGYF